MKLLDEFLGWLRRRRREREDRRYLERLLRDGTMARLSRIREASRENRRTMAELRKEWRKG